MHIMNYNYLVKFYMINVENWRRNDQSASSKLGKEVPFNREGKFIVTEKYNQITIE